MASLPSLTDEPTRHAGCCPSLSQPLLSTIAALLHSTTAVAATTPASTGAQSRGPAPLVLSVGSGTGLLEELLHAYLNQHPPTPSTIHSGPWRVEGVEVNPAVNVHLPEDRINHVAGTWAVLESRARDAAALLFVYPRDGALVRRYVDAFMRPAGDYGGVDGEQHERVGGNHERVNESGYDSGEGESEGGIKRHESRGPNSTETRSTPAHRGVHLALWLGPKCDWEDTGFGSFGGSDEFEVLDMRGDVGLAEYEMLAALRRKDGNVETRL
ncbi:hypothetical protein ANO14919_136920 [Xylariales sp. No.14919]|nr:hypothetical protein ANO14919_136920 [Xylariales sp. No.14919]